MTQTPAATAVEVRYAPERLKERADALARVRNGRIFSLAISLGITAALWWFTRDQGSTSWPFLAVVTAVPVVMLAVAAVRAAWAKRAWRRLPQGTAFTLLREGLWLPQGVVAWDAVAHVGVRQRRGLRQVVVEHAGEHVDWPLDALAIDPASLASAFWALSGGRHSVDFSALKP